MIHHDKQYLNLIEDVLTNGVFKTDRTGTGTYAVNSRQMRFDLSGGTIPLLTTKKMFTRGMIHEILWYFRGMTNIKYLLDNDVHIWDEWSDADGELGPVYGAMWRAWPDTQIITEDLIDEFTSRGYTVAGTAEIPGYNYNTYVAVKKIDQLGEALELIKNSPDSRRIIVNSWNPALLPTDLKTPKSNPKKGLQALPPCHCMFQFTVADGKLNCDLRQRSCDVGLGVPFNIVQYSIITHIIAKMCDLQPGEFVWNGVDVHIYANHVDQLKVHLSRGAMPYPNSPSVIISDRVKGISPEHVEFDDIQVVGYVTPYPKPLKMDVAV